MVAGLGDPAPPELLEALTHVPEATWNAVALTGVTPPLAVPPTSAASDVTPLVLYVGAEFCPYCAAQRWPLIAALARFGEFRGLGLSASASEDVYPDTPTFTFRGATYTSGYVRLEAVETAGRELVNGRYPPLESLTPAQETLFRTYNAPPYVPVRSAGSIPFLLIGERYLWVGAGPSTASFQGRTWQSIAAALATPGDDLSRSILANANLMTAAICALNGGRPTEVCGSAGVAAASRLLPPQGAP